MYWAVNNDVMLASYSKGTIVPFTIRRNGNDVSLFVPIMTVLKNIDHV